MKWGRCWDNLFFRQLWISPAHPSQRLTLIMAAETPARRTKLVVYATSRLGKVLKEWNDRGCTYVMLSLREGESRPTLFYFIFFGGGQNLLKVDNLIRARSLKKWKQGNATLCCLDTKVIFQRGASFFAVPSYWSGQETRKVILRVKRLNK